MGLEFSPELSQVMICGNPAMVKGPADPARAGVGQEPAAGAEYGKLSAENCTKP